MTTTTGRPMKLAAPYRAETATDAWENRSGCYNRPVDWWDGEDPALTEKARAVCVSCPVLAECLGEQMRLEEDHKWSRPLVRAGLTGSERIELFMDEKTDGPYDAEEARLLALESAAYGKPVREVAESGVSESTLRLAGRLAGEQVPDRQVLQAKKDSGLEKALANAVHIMALREEGVSRRQICARLDLARTPVAAVIGAYSRLVGESEEDPEERPAEDEQMLRRSYLDGGAVRLSNEQKLQAIVEGVARGMSYPEIDRMQGFANNTTAKFVSRMRKQYDRAGKEFPIKARQRSLTDEVVLEMRELYAAGGVTDMELAFRYGVERNVVSHVLSGKNYKNVGGPIRNGRTEASKQASKDANDGVCRMAFAPARAKKMEKAA